MAGHEEMDLDTQEAMEHVRSLRYIRRPGTSNSTDNLSEEMFIEGYAVLSIRTHWRSTVNGYMRKKS